MMFRKVRGFSTYSSVPSIASACAYHGIRLSSQQRPHSTSRLFSSTADVTSEAKLNLINLAEQSNRGQKFPSSLMKDSINSAINELEALNKVDSLNFPGTWRLIYADDDVTRASPFFWAFKKAFKNKKVPLKLSDSFDGVSDSIFFITDSIPFKSIGECMQTIEGDTLVSKVNINIDVTGLNLGSSVMTTTSRILPTDNPNVFELQVETTQVVQSTIEKFFPILKNNLKFPSGNALELLRCSL